MRAAVLRAYLEPLSLEAVADPTCEADGVVLKTLACGICRSDWHGWVGEHPKVKPGDIPGHEYCGEVVEAGPLAKWKPGDRVIAPFILACGDCPECRSGQTTTCRSQRVPGFGDRGAYAEYVSVPHAHNLTRLPESLSPALAAGLGCRVTTAFHALTGRAALQAGEWLAVHGTGGIGLS
ncbi:MAG TPA: alcohol dehydrogenase catalytic domain-containing protein, partial [Tabrizicola sp.]|nr:alcohol dehydrogenase catalytic domain-containing protein [Tabrizicola sp.]